MPLHSPLTDSQHLRHFVLGNLLHTSQPDNLPALCGQTLERLRAQLDLLVRHGVLLRGDLIYQDVQLVDIRDRLYGDDAFPPDSIEQQVMGRAEQEGPRGSWPRSPRSRIHASIRLLAQIAYIIASGPHMEQIADQHLFMRKDLALEPIVEWLFHSPTVPLIIGQRQALACPLSPRRSLWIPVPGIGGSFVLM